MFQPIQHSATEAEAEGKRVALSLDSEIQMWTWLELGIRIVLFTDLVYC